MVCITHQLMQETGPQRADIISAPLQTSLETERRARIDAVWEMMNKGVPTKILRPFSNKPSSVVGAPQSRSSDSWISHLGVEQKMTESDGKSAHDLIPPSLQNGSSDDIKKLAATALVVVKESAASGVLRTGKVEITEVRDFAGQDIEVKKMVDLHSNEGKASARPSSVVDAVLEKIRKRPKLSVLDKTKKEQKGTHFSEIILSWSINFNQTLLIRERVKLLFRYPSLRNRRPKGTPHVGSHLFVRADKAYFYLTYKHTRYYF